MFSVSSRQNEGERILFLTGRIDSSNADSASQLLRKEADAAPHSALTLSCGALTYVSSAGLRVLLRLRKEDPTLRLTDVSSEVYEVLDMTGFTEMMPVEKAFRRISVEGCELIGKGAIGTVYRIDEETIVKVFSDSNPLESIRRERELARKAFVLGIPTAISYDVVKVGDQYGAVFELIKTRSFGKLLRNDLSMLDRYVELSTGLMKKLHSTTVSEGELPSAKTPALRTAAFLRGILPSDEAEKLSAMIEAIPERLTLIHGDLHIKNLMMQDGEPMLIDMDTLSVGHPIFELAAQYETYCGYGEQNPDDVMNFFGIPAEKAREIWDKTLRLYLGTDDEGQIKEVEDKVKLLSYATLVRIFLEGNPHPEGLKKRQTDAFLHYIKELLSRVRRLDF